LREGAFVRCLDEKDIVDIPFALFYNICQVKSEDKDSSPFFKAAESRGW